MKCIRTAIACTIVMELAGCAVADPPQYLPGHPANPASSAAPPDSSPSALSTYRAFDDAARQPTREDGHAHHP